MKKEWQHSTHSTSFLDQGFKETNQPGGTITLLSGNWTSKVIDKGSDPFGLGRWSFLTLRGCRGIHILIITVYWVCTQTVASADPKTSTAQQFRKLSEHYRLADYHNDPVPWHQFIVDLQAWIEHRIEQGFGVILEMDGNKSLSSSHGSFTPLDFTLEKTIKKKGHDGSIATLIKTCRLCDPLLLQHSGVEPPPRTNGARIKWTIYLSPHIYTPALCAPESYPTTPFSYLTLLPGFW